MKFRNALVLTGCLTAATLSFSTPAASAGVLVGSLHLPLSEGGVGMVSLDNIATRHNIAPTYAGKAETVGLIAGTVDVATSSTLGESGYSGFSLGTYSGDTIFGSLTRAANVDTSLMAYDFDLSSYLAAHPAGDSAGDTTYTLDLNIIRDDNSPVTFYVSYNDGASISLDTTDVAGLTGDSASVLNSLVADTAHYVEVGEIPIGQGGTYSFDFTNELAASTDGLVRIVVKQSAYYGGIDFKLTNGIVASPTVVVPEPSAASLLLLGVGGLFGMSRRGRNRNKALKAG